MYNQANLKFGDLHRKWKPFTPNIYNQTNLKLGDLHMEIMASWKICISEFFPFFDALYT